MGNFSQRIYSSVTINMAENKLQQDPVDDNSNPEEVLRVLARRTSDLIEVPAACGFEICEQRAFSCSFSRPARFHILRNRPAISDFCFVYYVLTRDLL
jgi:hypothetical protein